VGACGCYAVSPMPRLLLLSRFFALAFSALLPLVNPLGSALVFLGIVGNAPAPVFRDLARKIAISMTLFMLAIELVGSSLLQFFGISLPVVQVAGGLVLASMGWSLLNQQETPGPARVAEVSSGSLKDRVFYPLTFPVTVGPGSIVVMLTLSAHASVEQGLLDNVIAHLGISLALLALSATVFLSYRYAPKITERISPPTAHGILRIIAFVLLCIGVQITWNGLHALLQTLIRP
jgi:multiple antibiotic resistance protein